MPVGDAITISASSAAVRWTFRSERQAVSRPAFVWRHPSLALTGRGRFVRL